MARKNEQKRRKNASSDSGATPLKIRVFQIIFESDTPAAKGFDLVLVGLILASVMIVLLDSIPEYHQRYGELFRLLEWGFTLLFTAEYLLRLYCVARPWAYARSFFGVIDLLSIIPTWLSIFITGGQSLLVVRVLRVLRLFRVLRLMIYVNEGHLLLRALSRSRHKIFIFLFSVSLIILVFASLVYLIEPPEAGFTSIPASMYWGVVTLTTVGYGDIAPVTPVGKFVSALMMILGYSIIAVPTGVFSAEVARQLLGKNSSDEACPACGREGHDEDASHCKYCGGFLDETKKPPDSSDSAH